MIAEFPYSESMQVKNTFNYCMVSMTKTGFLYIFSVPFAVRVINVFGLRQMIRSTVDMCSFWAKVVKSQYTFSSSYFCYQDSLGDCITTYPQIKKKKS